MVTLRAANFPSGSAVHKVAVVAELLNLFGFLSVLIRALTLAGQTLAVGGVVFMLAVARPLTLNPRQNVEGLQRCGRRLVVVSALGVAVAQVVSVSINSAVLMATAELSLGEVVGANFFVSGFVGAASSVILALVVRKSVRFEWQAGLALAVVIIGTSVMTSHAVSRPADRASLAAATALHHAAAAVWVGGLPYLLLGLRRCSDDAVREAMTRRFSRVAIVAVAVLATAGIALSGFYIDSPAAIYGTAYGLMVSVKVVLFGLLLLLGGLNFETVRRSRLALGLFDRLRCLGEAEVGIGFTVILAAASLTSVPPAVDLSADRLSVIEIIDRMTPRWPRLSSPSADELSEPTLQTLKKASAAGAPLPQSFVPGGTATHPNTPSDIAWSEYNHHWAGLTVVAIGLFALCWRTGRANWARHWPLLFLGLAAFIVLRADPENWPLGPNGFWESFADSEVLQHRAYAGLIAAFGLLEWRVEAGVRRARSALIFPLICAVGGALLLTHSHSLGNVKEELLAEMSHAPIALLGVLAGWSRWLELRLPQAERRIPGWIWPPCFVLIGLLLLFYRES
jgi:putative copper resistance protein D